ncbi:thiamine-phosphate kinase [Ferruginivarius sediminum]|uniref:Thiamine-monophosphate kinase n=1 Tax=Ferruginivarius sediminum TaxID=2661937 RepID=A0A369TLK7_9PROT|nr:thiamine-phosphate kinase [Ferruginivarius sediminum]RDD63786.1 thiamine-phosphate kinase [Ferruginivarius sediminum]
MLGEFEIIARYFAPLAEGTPGALGLGDDAAVLSPPAGEDLVFTTDTIVSGVHFLSDDPPDQVARKLLRVNLSDLAAMGARPLGYLLSFTLPATVDEAWIEGFAQGLASDQDTYAVGLLGGDTTSTPGPTTLSLTAVGRVPAGRALRRGGAKLGDIVFVSGTIGDSALGLEILQGRRTVEMESDRERLVDRYRLPRPRMALGRELLERGLASAAIDVSDGLAADLGHICASSGVGAEIDAVDVPLSAAVQRLVESDAGCLVTALTGGDDYELMFTVPERLAGEVGKLAVELDLPLTRIGVLAGAGGVIVRGADGEAMELGPGGWTHF